MAQQNFQEDFSGLRFPVMDVPPGEDILGKVPSLSVHEPFRKLVSADKNLLIRFVILMADKGSPFMRYKHLNERINECLGHAGYMAPQYKQAFSSQVSAIREFRHEAANRLIEFYLTQVQEDYKFIEYYYSLRLIADLGASVEKGEDLGERTKNMENLRKARVQIEQLEPEIFGAFSQITTIKKSAIQEAEKRFKSGPAEMIPDFFNRRNKKAYHFDEDRQG